jgi:tripartite-type tricarboxylate transporter receptor subunit TctC
MRKAKVLCLMVGLVITSLFSLTQAADFPTKDFIGVIMWGAGGPTDIVSRFITPLAEKQLGKQIVLQNKTGASGATSIQWVLSQPSDGYTLLYGAENPLLHRVMDVPSSEYDNLYPVLLMARDTALVVVKTDAPWKTIQDLFEDARKNPGQIKMGVTGTADIMSVVSAMFEAENKVTFNKIPFSGGGAVIPALLGGHAQVTILGIGAVSEHIRGGRVKALATVSNEYVPGMENIPLITSVYPQYKKYFPWGTFYGIWVKKDVPDDVKKKLVDAFQKGSKDPKFQTFLKDNGLIYLGSYGDEGNKFLKHWQSVTTWLLHNVGALKFSPDKFGIPKP